MRNGSKIALGAAAVGTVVFILTFALWVLACVDCHRYRYSERYPIYRRGIRGGNDAQVAAYPVHSAGAMVGNAAHDKGGEKQQNLQPMYA